MGCKPRTDSRRLQTKKQIIAIGFFVYFMVIALFFEAFILTYRNHAHDQHGGACATCTQIQNTENALRQFGAAVIGGVLAVVGLCTAAAVIRVWYARLAAATLITAKIRMNN